MPHRAMLEAICIALAPLWPSKRPEDEVHLFIINNFAIVINLAV
jgi:hypothetical protein